MLATSAGLSGQFSTGLQNANSAPPPNGIATRLEASVKFAHDLHSRLIRVTTLLGGARPSATEAGPKTPERFLVLTLDELQTTLNLISEELDQTYRHLGL